jgi:KipI family sensor histidine kinase inhibitor
VNAAPAEPTFIAASDQALLVRFAVAASDDAWSRVWRLVEALELAKVPGVVHWQPASASVLLRFDPLRTDPATIEMRVRDLLREAPAASAEPAGVIEVPVAYGGEHGPDLAAVAAHCRLSPAAVVAAHAGSMYRVDFFGFVAGFAYLSGLPAALATPRLAEPRARVPAGSVAIGGTQTAIYPAATPGGWRLIGRSPLRPARFGRLPWTLYRPGDRVRFVPISAAEFARRSEWP